MRPGKVCGLDSGIRIRTGRAKEKMRHMYRGNKSDIKHTKCEFHPYAPLTRTYLVREGWPPVDGDWSVVSWTCIVL